MRRLLVLAGLAAAALAAGVAPASATNECKGLQVCVPVAGPWVVVPAGRAARRPHVEFQLSCPRGFVVGGIDVELSARAIDVAFLGRSGSPVNPGITTTRDAVFLGTYVGAGSAATSFRPHIGCLPSAGGGGRVPAVVGAFPPGQPALRRVRTVRLSPGARTVAQGCATGERLVTAAHAFGFYTQAPPGATLVASVSATQAIRGDRVVVAAHAGGEVRGVRAVLQVEAVCAGGR